MIFVFTVFVILVQLILFFGHWFLFHTAIVIGGLTDPIARLVLKSVLAILSVSFVSASILTFRYANRAARLFYTVAAVWLGVFHFLFMAFCLAWLAFDFLPFLNQRLLLLTLTTLALFVSIYGIINARRVRIKEISVPLPNLPLAWQNKTAVFFSDLQLGHVWNYKFAKRVAAMISSLKPDMVLTGGDFYDGVIADLAKLAQPFSEINPPLGFYFITGNHEEFSAKEPYLAAVKSAGLKVLDNELVEVAGLQLVGVDYKTSTNKKEFKGFLKSLPLDRQKPSILLKHAPDLLQIPNDAGISLQLSGHTHHGQMFPFGLVTRLVYRGYHYGLKNFKNLLVYTTSGVGTWGPPLRVGSASEIVLLRFQTA